MQLITCSHSPEILMGAFERAECSVHHLKSTKKLAKVRRKDEDIISDALRRLGSSEVDGLLYKAVIFVEGEHHVELLRLGFDELLRKYKLNDRGGRREIEKLISAIQDAEKQGKDPTRHFFVLDHDEKPTTFKKSDAARILQWDRRCLENYLIDVDVLTDLLKNEEIIKGSVSVTSVPDTMKLLRDLALEQLGEFVAKKVYQSYGFDSPDIKRGELQGKDINVVADDLFIRLAAIASQLSSLSETSWKEKFVADCATAHKQLKSKWDERWMDVCDGKRLFRDLQQQVPLKMSIRHFKRRVISEMTARKSQLWQQINQHLVELLS